jgi:anti-sigma B factor antagonist
MPSKIDLKLRNIYGFLILDITGNIELDSLKKIQRYIDAETGNSSAKIILNLENVEYISSSAINELAKIISELALKQKSISLLNLNNDIIMILTRHGLINYFKILSDEDSIMEKKRESELDDILDVPSED